MLIFILLVSMFSCADGSGDTDNLGSSQNISGETTPDGEIPREGLWANATYTSDRTFGLGSKTVKVEVKVGDSSVTFTINTDRETLGDALLDHQLIEGENSQYGIYIKKVNGITADYNIDGSYWGFYKDGEYMMTGVDQTNISVGDHYELVYSK